MSERFCAIDVGTNTLLGLIVERAPGGTLRALCDLEHITRLGRGVGASGRLSDEGIERAMRALRDVAARARSLGVAADRIHAVGTSAMRDAANRGALIERAHGELGITIEVVDGAREAALTFRGALPGLAIPVSDALTVVDIGGGSTEIASGHGGTLERSASLDVGSVRLFERHLRDDPPHPSQVDALLRDVDHAIDRAEVRLERNLVALAGTACTVAAVANGVHPFDADAVHGATIAVDALREVAMRLAAASVDERRATRGVPPGREDVVAAGALLLLRIAERAGAPGVLVSTGGVRWGITLEHLASRPAGC